MWGFQRGPTAPSSPGVAKQVFIALVTAQHMTTTFFLRKISKRVLRWWTFLSLLLTFCHLVTKGAAQKSPDPASTLLCRRWVRSKWLGWCCKRVVPLWISEMLCIPRFGWLVLVQKWPFALSWSFISFSTVRHSAKCPWRQGGQSHWCSRISSQGLQDPVKPPVRWSQMPAVLRSRNFTFFFSIRCDKSV